jgi:hypothetical protein
LLLSGCVTTSPQGTQSLEAEVSPFPQAVPTPEVEQTSLTAEVMAPPEFEGSKILGLEPKVVEGLFGAASFVRWEGNAIIRQYQNDTCILDVIFYEEFSGEPFRAKHFESRSLSGVSLNIKDCIEGFFKDGEIPAQLTKGG